MTAARAEEGCCVLPASAGPLQRCIGSRNTFGTAVEYSRHWAQAMFEELNIRCGMHYPQQQAFPTGCLHMAGQGTAA